MIPQTQRAHDELNRLKNRAAETEQRAQLVKRRKLADEAQRLRTQLTAASIQLGYIPFGYLATAQALIVSASAQLTRMDEQISRAARKVSSR